MAGTSGFLVPPSFGFAATASAGCTQNSVTPTIARSSPSANSVSVSDGSEYIARMRPFQAAYISAV